MEMAALKEVKLLWKRETLFLRVLNEENELGRVVKEMVYKSEGA